MKRWVVGGLAVIGAIYLCSVVLVMIVDSFVDCRVTTHSKVPSPRGAHRALVTTELCGNRPVEMPRVWLTDSSEKEQWSAFLAPSVQRASGQVDPVAVPVLVVWITESQLQISFLNGMDLHSVPDSYDGVEVTYRDR